MVDTKYGMEVIGMDENEDHAFCHTSTLLWHYAKISFQHFFTFLELFLF